MFSFSKDFWDLRDFRSFSPTLNNTSDVCLTFNPSSLIFHPSSNLGVQEFVPCRGGSAYPPENLPTHRADTLICPYNMQSLISHPSSFIHIKEFRDFCSGGFAIRPHSRPLKRGGWEGIVILPTSHSSLLTPNSLHPPLPPPFQEGAQFASVRADL